VTRGSGPYTLGIDLGVTGARAAVADRAGTVAGRGRVARPGPPGAWLGPHDPGQWVADAVAAARGALAQAAAARVEAIAVAALGPAPILVDAGLRPLTPVWLLSLDPRLEQQRIQLLKDLGLEAADVPPGHPIPQLLWWQQHATTAWERASMVLDATGFVVSALSGVPTMDTVTALDYSLPGLPCPVRPPEATDPSDIAGGLAKGPAADLGLPPGTPVAVGSYDSYIDLARMGIREPGDACILLGSTQVVGQVADAAPALPADSVLRGTPHLGAGQLIGGWTSAAGLTLDWCADVLGSGLEDTWGAVAGIRPGTGGLLVLPYLAGERAPVWDALARGAIVGLTAHTSRLEICRAVLDGVALSTRDLTERLRQVLPPPAEWRVSGGGVRNPAWMQATADAVGSPLTVIGEPGGVAAAAHAFAAIAAGPMKPPEVSRVVPDESQARRYRSLYEPYRGLYGGLAAAMHALAHVD
jgi:xylulokinase